jgi:nitronate monooxygenase
VTRPPVLEARQLLGIELPIVLGPMAGGPSTPSLAAAVSNAGGLGVLGEGYVSPDQLRRDIRATRERSEKPFGVNLFVPEATEVDEARLDEAVRALAPYRRELGLSEHAVLEPFAQDFDAQLDVVIEERVAVFTFTFGVLAPTIVDDLHRSGALVGGTATTPTEAGALADAGVDFVVAQGSEAGGHRATFVSSSGDDLIGLAALVPQVRDESRLPVVAAGGIADGRGVVAALALGACAAQLGTAFLLCPEAGTSAPYREAVRTAHAEDTVITSAFSGRRARGIVNRFCRDLAALPDLPPYPVMNALTREIRRVAADRGDAGLLSLWAGQGVGMVRELPAGELVESLAREMTTSRSAASPR